MKTKENTQDEQSFSEDAVIQTIVEARKKSGLTQKELAEKTGIAQGDISKFETGNTNPSLRTLVRLADGMGMQLKIELCPSERTKAIKT